MKKVLLVAVASTAFFSTSAFAADTVASQNVVVNANVDKECVVGAVQTVNLGTIPVSTTADANGLTVNADIPKGQHDQTIYLGCNTPMQVKFTARGLESASNATNPSLNQDGFTNKLNYSFDLSGIPGSSAQGTTNGSTAGVQGNRDAFYRNATVSLWMLKTSNAGRRPLAGTDYTDTAVITLTAF